MLFSCTLLSLRTRVSYQTAYMSQDVMCVTLCMQYERCGCSEEHDLRRNNVHHQPRYIYSINRPKKLLNLEVAFIVCMHHLIKQFDRSTEYSCYFPTSHNRTCSTDFPNSVPDLTLLARVACALCADMCGFCCKFHK